MTYDKKQVTMIQALKYRNPDPRCTYPFEPEPLGYCWGWANHIDGEDPKYKNFSCVGCDFWREKAK